MANEMQTSQSRPPAVMPGQRGSEHGTGSSVFNVPNTLCAIRLFGSFGLIWLALAGHPRVFLWLYVFLVFTDWIDGKLAILLRQRTKFGAGLDSAADATLYTALLFGFCWLKWEFVLEQIWWIIAVSISYTITCLAGLFKFKRIPTYHTWAAKASNHLIFIAVICLWADWAVWPFYVAMVTVILTNLEATAITMALRQRRADVRSIYHVFVPPNQRS